MNADNNIIEQGLRLTKPLPLCPVAPPPAAKPPPTAATIAVVKPRPQKPQKVEPIKGIKKVMVQTMTKALTIPHFNYCDEVNCSQLVSLRSQLKDIAKDSGVALSYMPFFIKAASLSLEHYPVLGATVDEDCQNLHYSESHNIGVAMDTPQGLLVPCIKGVESMTLLEVAQELNRLQQRGMEGKLSADDLKGATLTLSNIGAVSCSPTYKLLACCVGMSTLYL
ncbi:DBT [Cordylochernes scorpioides]|uniref:DBT n=1 Tax=Cordylochernes scorpioides TaxID=51811 RepID=A0ABY6LL76_9ARAC|nr:DBT [Cordylochernes scorpioides]